ncbi:MAG: hypothetical protein WA849_17465 [Candidatus Udaeobacter sp.]
MYLKQLPISMLVVWLLFTASVCAQDNPMDDPDLQQLLKQAQEMQKNSGSPDARKKLAEMEAMAKQEAAQQEQEETQEKEKLQAALKKQLEARDPVAFPDWTPVTPEFKPAGNPAKKAARRGSENCSDRHLVAYSGENSGKLASGSSRSKQSQSES